MYSGAVQPKTAHGLSRFSIDDSRVDSCWAMLRDDPMTRGADDYTVDTLRGMSDGCLTVRRRPQVVRLVRQLPGGGDVVHYIL